MDLSNGGRNVRRALLGGLGCALLAIATVAVAAGGDFGKQLQTAIQHAEFSSKSDNVKGVHLHLHHVVNCLEGVHGRHFFKAAGDPCKGQGNGALNDFSGKPAAAKRTLAHAHELALIGLQINQYPPAQRVALAVRELLQDAKKEAGGM